MLLPQSAAFAALKNRLNAVSAIGYLHIPPPRPGSGTSTTPSSTPVVPGFERPPARLKSREEGAVKWSELLEGFRRRQDQSRRNSRPGTATDAERDGPSGSASGAGAATANGGIDGVARKLMPPPSLGVGDPRRQSTPATAVGGAGDGSRLPMLGGPTGGGGGSSVSGSNAGTGTPGREHKSRFGAGHFGKLANAAKGKSKK